MAQAVRAWAHLFYEVWTVPLLRGAAFTTGAVGGFHMMPSKWKPMLKVSLEKSEQKLVLELPDHPLQINVIGGPNGSANFYPQK